MTLSLSEIVKIVCSDFEHEITEKFSLFSANNRAYVVNIAEFNKNSSIIFKNYKTDDKNKYYCMVNFMMNYGDHIITWKINDVSTMQDAVKIVDELDHNELNIGSIFIGNERWTLQNLRQPGEDKPATLNIIPGNDIEVIIPIPDDAVNEYLRIIALAYQLQQKLNKYNEI